MSFKKVNADLALREAKRKGYYCDFEGNVYSKRKKLALRKTLEGRYRFSIRLGRDRVTIPVHRFAAYLKYGDDVFKKNMVVRHLDGNPSNNSYDNLELGTQSQNMLDIPEDKRKASAKKEHFSEAMVRQIHEDRMSGSTYRELCEKYNTTVYTLRYMFTESVYYQKAIYQ